MSPTFHDDAELLRRYQAERTPAAFEALVARHLPLVWSTARRVLVSCPALAEDVAQMVFADFARQALALRADRPAGGWLHRHAWFTAATVLRSELRRRERETTAAMNDDRSHSPADAPQDDTWERLAPHLDEALAALPAADREAVVMRFFERWDFARIGAALRISDEAARKRVARALEKLRRRLTRQGAVPAAAALGLLLGSHALAAPPAGMAAQVAAASWARAGAAAAATGTATLAAKLWLALKSAPLAVPAASVALLCGALWWWSLRPAAAPEPSRAVFVPPPPPSLAAPGETLRVRGALFDVEESLAARLLTGPDRDDAALWQHLSAAAVPAPDPASRPDVPEDEAARPSVVAAAVFDESAVSGHALEWKRGFDYKYPLEFEPRDMEPPLPIEADHARFVGTEITLAAGRKEKDGTRTVQWRLDHHFAPPVVHSWAVRVDEDGGESEVGTPFPFFSNVSNAATTRLAAEAATLVLAVKTPPPPGLASAEAPPARRLLFFLQTGPADAPSR